MTNTQSMYRKIALYATVYLFGFGIMLLAGGPGVYNVGFAFALAGMTGYILEPIYHGYTDPEFSY